MLNVNVIDKEPLGLAELKEELAKIQKRDEELGFRSGKTMEYVNSFSTLDIKTFNEVKDALKALDIPRLKDEHIVKIVDLMPINVADLDVILQGYPITISKENQAKIVETVSGFRKA
ncbi:MAG: hypothetical protein ACMXX9_03915 [Candidatus Woesearchaeota archaeon]